MTRLNEYMDTAKVFLRVLISAIVLLMITGILSSCEHKDLCYDHPHRQNVEVVFDWSDAPDANPSTMSVYLYPEKGGEPIRYVLTNNKGGIISVPSGTYDVIGINSDKETHRVNGTVNFRSFVVSSSVTRALQGLLAAMAKAEPRARGTEKERVMQGPEMLYSSKAEKVVVKPAGEKTIITLKPKARVNQFSVEIQNVENINSVKAMSGSLSGLSGGWMSGLDKLSEEKVTTPFVINRDPDLPIVRGSEKLFGHCPETAGKHMLMIYAQLTDGTNWYYEVDVTDQMHDPKQDPNHIKIVLDKLPLPKVDIPGSGMAPSVDKWNEIHIDIIM